MHTPKSGSIAEHVFVEAALIAQGDTQRLATEQRRLVANHDATVEARQHESGARYWHVRFAADQSELCIEDLG